MEKDDEITGTTGSHYTATFWEYDTRIGRRWNLDPKPEVGISQYVCFVNNPIFWTDPFGDSVDPTKLYEKDDKGELKYKDKVLAFEMFASTDEGEKFLLDHAQEDFKLQGELVKDLNINATEAGSLHKEGIDLEYQMANQNANWTSPFVQKDDRLLIQININRNSSGLTGKLKLINDIDTYAHESLLHGDLQGKRYIDGERDRMKIMGPDHSNTLFTTSKYYKFGLDILEKTQKMDIPEMKGDNYSRNFLYYNIMLPGVGK